MDLFTVVVLGIVEGITEYVPVSSTGHLILFGTWLDFTGEAEITFKIFIQLGAILAVVFLYYDRMRGLLDFSSGVKFRGDVGFKGVQGLLKIFLACLPAFVLGAVSHEKIREHLFGPTTVALALIFGGLVMITLDRWTKRTEIFSLEKVGYLQAFLIGVFQCFALWPGMSRSGSTIVGGIIMGLNRKTAAEFSFLVAVPVMAAAVLYDLWKSWHILEIAHLTPFALGFVISFITGVAAIKFLLAVLGRYTLRPFGYYRVVIGALVLILLYS